MISINDMAREIHKNAVEHGWWDTERQLPEVLMLCVSELAEALEEYRSGRPMAYVMRPEDYPGYPEEDMTKWRPEDKPEGVATEMADCLIRILDYLAHAGVDIDAVVEAKHRYNRTRPYRHGGKRC